VLRDSFGEISYDGSVGVEQIYDSEKQISRELIASNVPSRVIPGFRGTPAGIITISAPLKHSLSADGV
jgi:hypothetical protein